jgi:hypothetical protein
LARPLSQFKHKPSIDLNRRNIPILSMLDTSIEIPLARTALVEKKLYKFRSFADQTQQARLKEIIVENRIRFSRPSELNDPLEGKPIFCLGDWESPAYRQQLEEWAWHIQPNKEFKGSASFLISRK